jgi:hypothetical protein
MNGGDISNITYNQFNHDYSDSSDKYDHDPSSEFSESDSDIVEFREFCLAEERLRLNPGNDTS